MLLEVKNLKTQFFTRKGIVTAVDDVSFALEKGKTLCLVGESGSGKSVTALSVMGLIEEPGRVMGGEILFDSRDLSKQTEKEWRNIRGSQISMIFQDPMASLNPSYNVGSQIAEVIRLHQPELSKKEAREQALEALKKVAIPEPETRINEYPFRLSGGMRQRVMIAMAMACQPKLLIADEPTTALDVTIQAQILALMNELKEKENTAILFITHNLGVVSQMADSVAVMYTGKTVEITDAQKLFKNPRHPYTEGLIKSLPSQNQAQKSRLYSIPDKVPSPLNLPKGCTFWPRCPYAQDRCKQEIPPLTEIDNGHWTACFKATGEI